MDTLRVRLDITTLNTGCDDGQWGSCTVLLDGRRHLTRLILAVQHDGAGLTTADGLTAIEGGGPWDL